MRYVVLDFHERRLPTTYLFDDLHVRDSHDEIERSGGSVTSPKTSISMADRS